MWQVYLMLANDRQAADLHKAAEPHLERAPRVRRWRPARRASGVATASETRSHTAETH
jgi:hypothetical protein